MKHFFQVQKKLDSFSKKKVLDQAIQELKVKPINPANLDSAFEVVCINSTNIAEYVAPGFETLLLAKNLNIESSISPKFLGEVEKLVKGGAGQVAAYILGNIQTKEIEKYFDLILSLKRDYDDFESLVLVHLSDQDMITYLRDFISAPAAPPEAAPPSEAEEGTAEAKEDEPEEAGTGTTKIEVFLERAPDPWQTITKESELQGVAMGTRRPGILDRPFFSDIKLKLKMNNAEKVQELPIGKIKTALGHFNKKLDASGMVHRSRSSLFLKWKDIEGFKVASAQGKGLAGISIDGEFISTGKFITENIGGNFIAPDKVDFFRMKIGPELVDLHLSEITDIEVNTETQQIIFTRGVGRDENHVARFQKLKLHKGGKTAVIDRFIPFNRGESNFEMAERFLATRFIQYEKARQLHQGTVELEYLTGRNIYAGDVNSQLVLSSMKLLNILPLEAPCLGSGPLDINNKVGVRQGFVKNAEELKAIFTSILDLKATPNFTEHDFNRLTKRIRLYIGNKEPLKLSAEEADDLLVELEHLTQYMDDYFNLNLYNRFEEDLEVDAADPHENAEAEAEEHHLDTDAKDFISDNYAFFQKREVVRSALLRVESLRFYLSHVKVYADMPDKEPDLVVFASGNSLVTHFQNTSYPSFALVGLLNKEVFASESLEDDLAFIQFMRGFAKKVFQKAQEINKSFHHQYKHTLAELTFLADEKREHLQGELALLEDPNNKEKAYAKLLEKLTKIFNEQLTQKEEGIEALLAEKEEIKGKIEGFFAQLEKLLGEKLEVENLTEILESMPTRLEEMKATILLYHKKKKNQIIKIYNPLSKFQNITASYFHKAYNFVGLFQKAFYVKKKEAMLANLSAMIPKLLAMTPEQLEQKKAQWEATEAPMSLAKESSEQAKVLAARMKTQILELQKYSVKGMFQNPEVESGPLLEYFAYYETEAQKMKDLGMQTKMLHHNLEETEKELFELQSKIVDQRLAAEKKTLTVKMAQLALGSPDAESAMKKSLEFDHEVPREIRKELTLLRQKLTAAQEPFKATFSSETLAEACDFAKLNLRAKKRSEINEIAKELVNLEQGYTMIDPEVEGEKEALEYLRGQEGKLEEVAMSKALPSTRILLKTQYIPLVEKEKKMLKRADLFLSEIVSRGDKLKEAFVNCFFRKRYGFPQFLRGSFCLDTTGGAKSATLKNINQAYLLLGEKYPKGCAPAAKYDASTYFKKIEILGPGAIKERIRDIWTGGLDESFICVPGSYSMAVVLDLCKYKDELAKDINVSGRSNHSITLIYIAEISFAEIQGQPEMLEDYHQAIMSNIFINIDGVNIYNNRQSIYEGFVQGTFGQGTDAVSQSVANQFLNEA